jgi:chromosome segregation ATPase
MAEESPPEFRFNADDQEPEAFYHEEIKDLKVEKLSQRVTLIAILLPCILGVAIYFGYRDITGRLTKGQDTGYLEVQKLSREIDDLSKKFNQKLITFSTTLSAQDKDFDASLKAKLTAINKNVDLLTKDLKSFKKELKQTQNSISNLATTKADKKDQEAAIAKISASLEPLKKDIQGLTDIRSELKTVSSEIKVLEDSLKTQLAELAENSEQSRKDFDQIQSSIAALSGGKIDKATLDLEVFKLKKNFHSTISQAIDDLNKRLNSIDSKIDNVNKNIRSSKKSMKSVSKKIPPTTTTRRKTGLESKTPALKSGTINEQDIVE